jgi:hypothetical protein
MASLLTSRTFAAASRRGFLQSNHHHFVAARSFASVGDSLPSVELHQSFPPKKYNLADFAKNKNILLVGLPGAFTPTWSTKQIPNYLEHQDALREAGIHAVIVYCVNDAAVMQAWAKDQKVGLVSHHSVEDYWVLLTIVVAVALLFDRFVFSLIFFFVQL